MPNSVAQIMKDSLFNEESLSILTDVLENRVGVEFLEKIPLVSYAVSLFKVVDYARDRWLFRMIARFIQSANLNHLFAEDREEALKHFTQDKKTLEQELDYLLQILDRYLEEDKSHLLALVYIEFIKGNIDLALLKTYAEMINRFLPGDYEALERGEMEFDSYDVIPISYLRLASLGLMQKINRIISDTSKMTNPQFSTGASITSYENGCVFKYTTIGKILHNIFFLSVAPLLVELDFSKVMYFT